MGAARQPDEPLEQRHRNLAASLQARLEEVYLGMLKKLAAATGLKSVCLAGGVAFNCVANGKIFESTPFERVYVQPAAGDAGLAVGAAYYVWHQKLGKPRSFAMEHAYWGPGFTAGEIRAAMEASGLRREGYQVTELEEQELARRAAAIIADGKDIGMVPGTGGMGAAGAGESQHRGGPAAHGNERYIEPENQAPGDISAVRAIDPGGGHRGMV